MIYQYIYCILYIRQSLFIFNIVLPLDCEWTEWEIGECSHTCGGGNKLNTRTKKVEEKYGGNCDGESTMEASCNPEDCPGNFTISLSLRGHYMNIDILRNITKLYKCDVLF